MKIYVPMSIKEYGAYLAYKWNAKFNYYLFVEGINVILFIFALLIICISIFIYWLIAPSTFPDVIENVKKLYLYSGLLVSFIITSLIFIFSIWSKNEKKLLSHMVFTLILTVTTMIVLLGTKAYMNTIYTQERFEEFFQDYCVENQISNKQKEKIKYDINVWQGKVEQTNLKDKYIQENIKLYQRFTIKSWCVLIILIGILVLNIYMLKKIWVAIQYNNMLEKNDNILEDDEIGII